MNTQPRFSSISPPVGFTQTVGSWGGNLSIHLGFYLQLPSRPISLSLSHRRALKSTRVRFRPAAICLCQAFISSLVPPFGNSKGELNTVYRPHLPLPSLLLPFCPFSVYCSTWNRTVIFTRLWIKGDARPVFFPPVLCTNLILFPETLCQSNEKTPFLSLFFIPSFRLKRWNAKCNNASGCMKRRECLTDPLCGKHDLSGLVLTGNLCYVCCFSLFLFYFFFSSIPFCMFVGIQSQKPFVCEDLCKWNWVVSMFGWGSKYWNKYLLGSLATLSIETQQMLSLGYTQNF